MRISSLFSLVVLALVPAGASACALDGMRGGRFSPFHAMLPDAEPFPAPISRHAAASLGQSDGRPDMQPAPAGSQDVADAPPAAPAARPAARD